MKTACLLLIALTVPAYCLAGWDCLENCSVSFAQPGTDPVVLCVLPDGSGPSLADARLISGQQADGTITLTVRDCLYQPVVNYPAEDLYLEGSNGNFLACAGGTRADGPTDANGVTTWSRPLRAGGTSPTSVRIMVNGQQLNVHPALPLRFNSPDLDGDLSVNLADVIPFAADFFGAPVYNFRSDFHFDGTINLMDLVVLSRALGSGCP